MLKQLLKFKKEYLVKIISIMTLEIFLLTLLPAKAFSKDDTNIKDPITINDIKDRISDQNKEQSKNINDDKDIIIKNNKKYKIRG